MDVLTNTFKLFSDETSLRIMILLFHEDFCVCQLTGITGISQPNISKKLAGLRNMDLVKTERKSKYTYYSLHIKDRQFLDILKNIVNNLDNYTILDKDIKNSKSANQFIELATCS